MSHVFRGVGSFNVTLTVVSDRNLSSSLTKSVTIAAGAPPTADFVFSPTNPQIGQSVNFNASTSKAGAGHQISSYAWDFGDGGKGSGVSPTHAYGTAGTYNVVLIVTDEAGQTATASKGVPVAVTTSTPPPTADFVFSPAAPAVNQSVAFNASLAKAAPGHSITSYAWNFGDTGTGSGQTPSHTFGSAATYSVVLVVTDDLGQTGTASKTVPVSPTGTVPPPTALFVFSPATPTVGQTVLFNATQSTAAAGHTIANYSWSFGDGNTSNTNAVPTQFNVYANAGTYQVVLKVTDDLGQTGTTTLPIPVSSTSIPPPTAAFAFSPQQPAVGDTVSFDARASSAAQGHSIVSYKWTFGDNTGTFTSGTPTGTTHVYSQVTGAGTYAVVLVVTDDVGGTGATTQNVTVGNAPAPTAKFTFSPTSPVTGDTVIFDTAGTTTAQGQSIARFDWNFGDGTPISTCHVPPQGGDAAACTGGTNRTISHIYAAPGGYSVNLVVTDTAGRTGSVAATLTVGNGNPTASFTFSPGSGHTMNFDASASTAVGTSTIVTYAWLFGDGNSGSGGPLKSYTYSGSGTFSVRLTVTDNLGRSGTFTTSVNVP